jgi:excisionase family DNA binding protein
VKYHTRGDEYVPPIFVDVRDLAERLDVNYETVLTWVRRGQIPHIRDGRNRLLFNLNTVLDALRRDHRRPEAAILEEVAP